MSLKEAVELFFIYKMYSILFSIMLFAAFLFYHSSEKVKFANRPLWLEKFSKQRNLIKGGSLLLILLCGVAITMVQGIGAGSFALIVYMMGAFSLVILLAPYALFRWYQLALLFVFSLSLELFVF